MYTSTSGGGCLPVLYILYASIPWLWLYAQYDWLIETGLPQHFLQLMFMDVQRAPSQCYAAWAGLHARAQRFPLDGADGVLLL